MAFTASLIDVQLWPQHFYHTTVSDNVNTSRCVVDKWAAYEARRVPALSHFERNLVKKRCRLLQYSAVLIYVKSYPGSVFVTIVECKLKHAFRVLGG